MSDSHRYAMLLSALPYHGPLFGAKQTPLSRIRLQQRLALLDTADRQCLDRLSRLLDWAHQEPYGSDSDFIAAARRTLEQVHHPFARDLAIWRLELRTLVAALRRRHRGESAPATRDWGFGRWTQRIERNWRSTDLGLGRVFPWIEAAARHLERGESMALERLLLGVVWTHLDRISDGHYFDLEAVILYWARWDLIARWTSYQETPAAERFEALVRQAVANGNAAPASFQ